MSHKANRYPALIRRWLLPAINLIMLGYVLYLSRHIELGMSDLFWLVPIALLSIPIFACEAAKWHVLVQSIHPQSFTSSFSQVLLTHATGLLAPLKAAEIPSRAILFPAHVRKEIALATAAAGGLSLVATLTYGGIGSLFLDLDALVRWERDAFTASMYIGVLSMIIAAVLFYRLFLRKQTWTQHFRLSILSKATSWALIKYLVFAMQFALLLHWAAPHVRFLSILPLLGLYYVIVSIVPAFALLDLGARYVSGIYLFEMIGITSESTTLCVSVAYLCNQGLPMLGSLVMFARRR